MNNRSGVLRLLISGLFCVLTLIYAFINIITTDVLQPFTVEKHSENILLSVPANGSTKTVIKTVLNKSESNSEKTEGNVDTEKTASVSTDEKVVGKIIEKFITPYTANTSYSNVYLKNSTGLDISIEELLSSPIGFNVEKNSDPQVLIMHTHTT